MRRGRSPPVIHYQELLSLEAFRDLERSAALRARIDKVNGETERDACTGQIVVYHK
jgi:hypothetical protein